MDITGSTAYRVINTATAQGSAPLIFDWIYALPPQYRPNAKFLASPTLEKEVRKLVDGQNRYLFGGYAQGAYTGKPGQMDIDGFPVLTSQFFPTDSAATAQTTVGVFGDLGAYIIVTRTQMSITILRERFADTDQTGIIIFDRVGGALWNEDAIRMGIVTATTH